MHAERGFTLIEILVVIVIISTTISFALLAFGDFGTGRKAIVAAEEFSSYLKLVQHRALLEANALGLVVSKDHYETYRLIDNTWQAMPVKSLFHRRNLPASIICTLHVHTKNRRGKPDIVINTAGDMTEFTMDFGTLNQPTIVTLLGKQNGQLILQSQK
ncbi:prepilin-type N-terminal cleavage/methylation domain-containing protein [Legionella fairfieldensis]|uniref:prepilin-type N-terminal cleavage/methylation domain-containing protein n=1 Tax=Legionella fairfieldensis TaxID=45064 RepID=UPI00048FEECF|nr:prepilin-type N-terminal cleavage/methylation domain-containing protein [Legionella fairfieldensis]